jgi:putative transposase
VKSSKENLKHTKWECKYDVVFIPKYRRKVMYGWIRKELGPIMRELAQQKESEVEGEEGHLMGDHVHMMVSIPPKYSVSGVVGYIKGKSAIAIARRFMDRTKNFGVELLGDGLLRVDGGAGRDASAPVHPRAGERRSSARSTKDVRIASVPA